MKNTERYVKENLGDQWKTPKMDVNPFPCGCDPSLDMSQELNPVLSSYYQSQIGILRCMVELGQIDTNTKFLMLALHLALPREVHLETVLKKSHSGESITLG